MAAEVPLQDTFTGTAGTDLNTHQPDVGDAVNWTRHSSYSTADLVLSDANRLREGAATSPKAYYHQTDPKTNEYDIEVSVLFKEVVFSGGPAGRISTSADTYYVARYNQTSSAWELLKFVAGTSTSLGTYSFTEAVNNNPTIKLRCWNADIRVFKDGVQRISSTDTAITARGVAGVVYRSSVAGSNTTRTHLDNLSVYNRNELLTGADSASLSEGAPAADASLSASDSQAFSDLVDSLLAQLSGSDTAGGADSSTLDTGGTAKSGSDSATLAEAASIAASIAGAENPALGELASIAVALSRADSQTLADLASLAAQISRSDPAAFAETAQLAAGIAASDPGALADLASVAAAVSAALGISLADAAVLTAAGAGGLIITERGALSDPVLRGAAADGAALGAGILLDDGDDGGIG